MLDGMSDSIQRSMIENLHSREVDPTGLILLHFVFECFERVREVCIYILCKFCAIDK